MKMSVGCIDRSEVVNAPFTVFRGPIDGLHAILGKTPWDLKSAFKILFLLQTLYTGVRSQCKTYANSTGSQNQTQSGSSAANHGECIACDNGYSLQNKECIPESQGFDLTTLPGIILVISVGGCIIMCLAFHVIQKRCSKKNQKTTQGPAPVPISSEPVRNTLSHQQWSCRMSKLCSFKVFTASERGRKLEELARQSLPPPIMPYQVHKTTLDRSLQTDGPTLAQGQPVQTENPTIQGIQFLDVGQASDRPQISPNDDVMIVLGNPPNEECTVNQNDKIAVGSELYDQELRIKLQDPGETKSRNDQSPDTTKLVSDFSKLSSNFRSGFNPTRADLPTIGHEDPAGTMRRESWKAEEA